MKQYAFIKNPNFDPKIGSNEYGYAIDKSGKIALIVKFESELFQKEHYHILSKSARLVKENYDFCLVKMDRKYLDFFTRMPSIIEPVLMHELGHFINGDWDPNKRNTTSDQIKAERTFLVAFGKVPKEEILADRFAAENAGIYNTIEALRILKKERERGEEQGFEMAVREFELRIKELESYYNKG